MSEIEKLEEMLKEAGIEYTKAPLYGGWAIKAKTWDAVCHPFSYGGENGLLEIAGDIVNEETDHDTVVGHLTADDVMERVKKKEKPCQTIKVYEVLEIYHELIDDFTDEMRDVEHVISYGLYSTKELAEEMASVKNSCSKYEVREREILTEADIRRCACCGKFLDNTYEKEAKLKFTFGYLSRYDGNISETEELCWDCYDAIFDEVKAKCHNKVNTKEYM